jgi:hypothetical protein
MVDLTDKLPSQSRISTNSSCADDSLVILDLLLIRTQFLKKVVFNHRCWL